MPLPRITGVVGQPHDRSETLLRRLPPVEASNPRYTPVWPAGQIDGLDASTGGSRLSNVHVLRTSAAQQRRHIPSRNIRLGRALQTSCGRGKFDRAGSAA